MKPTTKRVVELFDAADIAFDFCYPAVVAAYSQPHRKYHDFSHLERIIRDLNTIVREVLDDRQRYGIERQLMSFSAMYHDFVYVPGCPDNEELSARTAIADRFSSAGHEVGDLNFIETCIMATKGHTEDLAETVWHRILIDADLAGLADDWKSFTRSTENIREEFSHVSQQDFVSGRIKWIDSMLDRPTIFLTDYMKSEKESKARENLERERLYFTELELGEL